MSVAAFWKVRLEVMVCRGRGIQAFVVLVRDGLVRGVRQACRLSLEAFEHLIEQGRLRTTFALRRYFAVLELVLGVADATARLFDVVFDHRHDGVISDTAFARTVVVHDVAGPKPALLHALPRNTEVRQITVREGKRARLTLGRAPSGRKTSSSDQTLDERSTKCSNESPARQPPPSPGGSEPDPEPPPL